MSATPSAHCHQEISERYKTHPMGRSLDVVGAASPSRPRVPDAGLSFEKHGLTYEVQRRGDRVVHKETRRDGEGRVLSAVEAEIQFAPRLGHARVSYLFERDGFLFQSPISWYTQERKWDLAPGYGRENPHFTRPIDVDCLYCHANAVDPVPAPIRSVADVSRPRDRL